MLADRGARRVVCASAGNLGQALAWSGRARDLDVTVVASRFAPAIKLDRIRALGARLEVVDGDHELARERAADLARRDGIRLLEDSLDLETCEGAGTIGLELLNSATPFDTVLIALGGGALATGIGSVMKACAPQVEVICVQPLGAPALTWSWHRRSVVTTDRTETIADSVAGRFPIPEVLDDLLVVADDALLVQEASIVGGMRLLLEHAGLVVEPAAALGIAAILENRIASPADASSPSSAAATWTWSATSAGLVTCPPAGGDDVVTRCTTAPSARRRDHRSGPGPGAAGCLPTDRGELHAEARPDAHIEFEHLASGHRRAIGRDYVCGQGARRPRKGRRLPGPLGAGAGERSKLIAGISNSLSSGGWPARTPRSPQPVRARRPPGGNVRRPRLSDGHGWLLPAAGAAGSAPRHR